MPLYVLGLMGVMRRNQHFDAIFQPYFIVVAAGAALIFIGIVLQILQLIVSIKNREALRDKTGDPWNGRTLEWATSSPAPFYNFAHDPVVKDLDPHWEEKQLNNNSTNHKRANPEEITYQDIHMPKDTSTGFWIAMFFGILGFAMVWHMVIPAIVGAVGIFCLSNYPQLQYRCLIYYVKAEEVKAIENETLSGGYIMSSSVEHHHHHDAEGTDVFGFWMYIMTDAVLFASLFATFLVLHHPGAYGPTFKHFIDLPYVLGENCFSSSQQLSFWVRGTMSIPKSTHTTARIFSTYFYPRCRLCRHGAT